MTSQNHTQSSELPRAVAVIPAAGEGRRVAPLPGSKEVLPLGTQSMPGWDGPRVRVVSQHLLEALKAGGAETAYWVLREGKWDIPAYWGDGHRVDVPCAYLTARWTYGVPFTIDQAYPFVKERVVLLGFPDILFHPLDAFRPLRHELATTDADVVLGCMPVEDPTTVDVVETAPDGTVTAIHVKPDDTSLREAWCLAAWGPRFSEWLHERIAAIVADPARRAHVDAHERHLGHLFQSVIDDGLSVRGVSFPDGHFFDIGTPENLAEALASAQTFAASPTPSDGRR